MKKVKKNGEKLPPQHPLETPVLFLVFNRPDVTKMVFESIREAKPSHLYVASDGPRDAKEGERRVVQEIRDFVTSHVDWKCEVKTLFRENNMGCGPAVKSAIDWFFDQEEKGIIVEDDCLPNQSFFWFCEQLLERYKDDDRIGMVSGNNHASYQPLDGSSYLFSRYKACWGWATWKRAWENMDIEMNWLNTKNKKNIIQNMGYSNTSRKHWIQSINQILNGEVNTWDWQWFFSLDMQNQLCIFPKYNLVCNIGFGEDATHTLGKPKKIFIQTKELVFPLKHPEVFVPDTEHDKFFENLKIKKTFFQIWFPRFASLIPNTLKNFVKKMI